MKKSRNFLVNFEKIVNFSLIFLQIFWKLLRRPGGSAPRNPPRGYPLTSPPLVDLASPPPKKIPAGANGLLHWDEHLQAGFGYRGWDFTQWTDLCRSFGKDSKSLWESGKSVSCSNSKNGLATFSHIKAERSNNGQIVTVFLYVIISCKLLPKMKTLSLTPAGIFFWGKRGPPREG